LTVEQDVIDLQNEIAQLKRYLSAKFGYVDINEKIANLSEESE